jgi:hypothetical protein
MAKAHRLASLAAVVIVIIVVIALTGSLHETTFFHDVAYGKIAKIPVWGVSLPLDDQEACTVAKQAFVKLFPESTSRNTFDCDTVNVTSPYPSTPTRRIWDVTDCSIQIYDSDLHEWENTSTAIVFDEFEKRVSAIVIPLSSEWKDFQSPVCANKTKT